MPKLTIFSSEMEFHPLSLADRSGRLFHWRGELMREIPADAWPEFKRLWDSGLIQELVAADLMPATELTEHETDAGARVLQHASIPLVTYPCEWSFGMLRDAALCVLEVNSRAAKHGYELKDAHGYNVVFHFSRPLFVDLGSLAPRLPGVVGWGAEDEFRRFFLHPLKIWSLSGPYVARRLLVGGETIGDFEAARLSSLFIRVLPARLARQACRARQAFAACGTADDELIDKRLRPTFGRVLRWLRRMGAFGGREKKLARALERISSPNGNTVWAGYHRSLREKGSLRIQAILARVGALKPEVVIDIGCNEGEFAVSLLRSGLARRCLALDADPTAIDVLYQRARAERLEVVPVLSDAMQPLRPLTELPQALRWRADVVLALALTHHLLLSQGYDVDRVLRRFSAFSRGHLLVEFMPFGLWDGKNAPRVPNWYTVEWFRSGFARHCLDVEEVQLEPNRILFQGRVRAQSVGSGVGS